MPLQFRRGTAAQAAAANPVLVAGEPAYDTTNGLLRVGDGVAAWSALDNVGDHVAPDNGGRAVGKGELVVNAADYRGAGVTDQAALVAAVGAVQSGGRLILPGTWTLTAAVAITSPITIDGQGGSVISDQRAIGGDQKLLDVQANDVTIRGVIFDGTGAPAGLLTQRHVAIYAGSGSTVFRDLTVEGCTFRNLVRKGTNNAGANTASLFSDYAVLATNMERVRLRGNSIVELSGSGLHLHTCKRTWITDNYVQMVSGSDCLYPIHLDAGNIDVEIRGNKIVGDNVGRRVSGGAIDVMSIDAPNKIVRIVGNTIDGSRGTGSGNSVIRVLSVEDAHVTGNTVRNIADTGQTMIYVDYRDLPTAQPGPRHYIVADNILIAGAADQRAIDVRNGNTASAAEDINVHDNQCLSDGTNWFASGIRVLDIARVKVKSNAIAYKYSATTTSSWGIEVGGTVAINRPVVQGNEVDCGSSALSRGIYLTGVVTKPKIADNTVVDWGAFGIRLTATTVTDPTITNNYLDGPDAVTAISNPSAGQTYRRGNRVRPAATATGTYTIPAAAHSVTISTAEVQVGDRIVLTVTDAATTAKPVKAIAIVADTSFIVRTVDQTTVTADSTGTWAIEH